MVKNFIQIGEDPKTDLFTVSLKSGCDPKQNRGLQVLNLKIENKYYLFHVA